MNSRERMEQEQAEQYLAREEKKLRIGDTVEHKTSKELAIVEVIKTKWSTGAGGFHVPTGWVKISFGFDKTATVREETLNKIKKEK